MGALLDFQHRYASAIALGMNARAFDPGLTVHRNTAAKAALDALADNYPVTRMLVGETAFANAARTYHAWRPPTMATLYDYGAGFDQLIGEMVGFDAFPFLPEIARLEWLRLESLFSADAEPLHARDIGTIDAATRLAVHPSVRIVSFRYPAVAIWSAHANDDQAGLETLDWEPETALIVRPDDAVTVTTIGTGAARFLSACLAGRTLVQATATLAPDEVSDTFAGLLSLGAFAAPATIEGASS